MTNPYIALQVNSEGLWQWRIEAVEGYWPWHGHYATEVAAQAAGETILERIKSHGKDGFEMRSQLIADSMDINERRHGRVR